MLPSSNPFDGMIRAVDIGLVNRVCPPEELSPVVYEMARESAAGNPDLRGGMA